MPHVLHCDLGERPQLPPLPPSNSPEQRKPGIFHEQLKWTVAKSFPGGVGGALRQWNSIPNAYNSTGGAGPHVARVKKSRQVNIWHEVKSLFKNIHAKVLLVVRCCENCWIFYTNGNTWNYTYRRSCVQKELLCVTYGTRGSMGNNRISHAMAEMRYSIWRERQGMQTVRPEMNVFVRSVFNYSFATSVLLRSKRYPQKMGQ